VVIAWSIAGIELTLKWNHVTDVNRLGSTGPFNIHPVCHPANITLTGQLIPFIIGIASLPSAIWGAFENWQEVKEEESHELQEVSVIFYSLCDYCNQANSESEQFRITREARTSSLPESQ
jgi:hypothetical protein